MEHSKGGFFDEPCGDGCGAVGFRLKIKKLRIVRYNEAGNIHRRRRRRS